MTLVLQQSIKNKIFYEIRFPPLTESPLDDMFSKLQDSVERSLDDKRRRSRQSIEVLKRASHHALLSKITNIRQDDSLNIKKGFNPDLIDFSLVIDGKTLELAMKNAESLKCLTIILFSAKSVCCFNMQPNHKVCLAKILKHSFSFKPIFMAVGNGFDEGMLNESSVSVSKTRADVVIFSFSQLKSLILDCGVNAYYNLSRVTLLTLYFNVCFTVVLVLYVYLSGLSGTFI